MDDEITRSHNELLATVNRLLQEVVPAEVVAGVLVALGMGLYRTIFDNDEYEAMMIEIYKSRNEVSIDPDEKVTLQ